MMRFVPFFVILFVCVCLGGAQELLPDEDTSVYAVRAGAVTEGREGENTFDPTRLSEDLKPREKSREQLAEEKAVAASQEGSSVTFLMSAGVEYTDEGEYEAAERAYLRGLEKDPTSPELLFRLSTLYTVMDRYEEAIEILKKRVVLEPESALLHNNISWCYSTGSGVVNPEKALWHAREALLSAPYQASVWNTLAEAYYVSGNYEKALRSAEYAIELLPRTKPTEVQIQEYNDQYSRIMSALDAMRMLDQLGQE